MAIREFDNIDDLRRRAELPARALDLLAEADALNSLDLNRRGGLWAAKGLPRAAPAPLFAFAGIDEADGTPPEALPVMADSEEVVGDYETIRLSLRDHPVKFLRQRIEAERGVTCKAINTLPNGRKVAVCGVVLVRQRPGSAKGVCFITLEDESGIANLVVWPKVFAEFRPVIMGAKMLFAKGRLQRSSEEEGGVTHLVVESLEDRTSELFTLSDFGILPNAYLPNDGPRSAAPNIHDPNPKVGDSDETLSGSKGRPVNSGAKHRHPRDVRVLPRSRDFH